MIKMLIALSLGTFSVACNSFMIAGLLPSIAQSFDQSMAVSGQAITVFNLCYLFSTFVFSVLLMNRRIQGTLQGALLLFVMGNAMTLFSHNILTFFFGKGFGGLGYWYLYPFCDDDGGAVCQRG